MSGSPIFPGPSCATRPSGARHWLPVLYALIFICFTSTAFMGGSHTQIVVNAVWKTAFGKWHADLTGEINGVSRKVGHFFGYGIIGLIFRNAWFKSAKAFSWVEKRWLVPFAAFLAIVSTFSVGCLDECHQMFLPGRVGCLHDALLDTGGAIFLVFVFWAIQDRKRSQNAANGYLSTDAMRAG